MRIILDISQDAAGRLAGTARGADGARERAFHGALELLNCIEELCDPVPPPGDPALGPDAAR